MKRLWILLCLTVITARAQSDRFTVEDKQTIEKALSFSMPAEPKWVKIDNIDGSITVTGSSGREVQIVVHKTIRAESAAKIELARQEVQLLMEEKANDVRIYVDAPYRSRDGSSHNRGSRFYGYRVRFDFELRVPSEAGVYARTVNGGEIKIDKTSGEFDIENINGGIEMTGMSGFGRAYALNGKLRALFDAVPRSNSFFGSLNGQIEVHFPANLSADLRLKNFNGGIYTDFPVTQLPAVPVEGERRNGKFVYKGNRFYGVRVGSGGPELKFDGFNGDIRILKREN